MLNIKTFFSMVRIEMTTNSHYLKISINSTGKTPAIALDPAKGIFCISGRSIPENALDFFEPIIEGFEVFLQGMPKHTVIEIKITHINTSSYNQLLDLLKIAEEYKIGCNLDIVVRWYYEEDDEDMYETVQDASMYVEDLPVEAIAIMESGS